MGNSIVFLLTVRLEQCNEKEGEETWNTKRNPRRGVLFQAPQETRTCVRLRHWWRAWKYTVLLVTLTLTLHEQERLRVVQWLACLLCHQAPAPMLQCGFQCQSGLQLWAFSLWHFLKPIVRGLLRIPPSLHLVTLSANQIQIQ